MQDILHDRIPIAAVDIPKTAVTTPIDLFEFNGMLDYISLHKKCQFGKAEDIIFGFTVNAKGFRPPAE